MIRPTCICSKTSYLLQAWCGLGPGPGWGPVRVGARSGLEPIWAHMGPYGPIWALMGPYGPIWALMGPPGQVLEDYVNFRKTFGQISHVSGPKIVF